MENRFLIIDYDPYSFVYSEQDSNFDFDSYIVYETYDRVLLPFPMGVRIDIKDKNKVHFNLEGPDTLQLSKPIVTFIMSWQAMEERFRPSIDRLLNVSRLKARVSMNSGKDFFAGEFLTKIKKEDLTGYNTNHLKKITLTFSTKLESDLLSKMAL